MADRLGRAERPGREPLTPGAPLMACAGTAYHRRPARGALISPAALLGGVMLILKAVAARQARGTAVGRAQETWIVKEITTHVATHAAKLRASEGGRSTFELVQGCCPGCEKRLTAPLRSRRVAQNRFRVSGVLPSRG